MKQLKYVLYIEKKVQSNRENQVLIPIYSFLPGGCLQYMCLVSSCFFTLSLFFSQLGMEMGSIMTSVPHRLIVTHLGACTSLSPSQNSNTVALTNLVQQENLITVLDQVLRPTCEVFDRNMHFPLYSPLASFHVKHNVTTLFRCNHDVTLSPPAGFINLVCPEFNIFCPNLDLPPPPPILDQPQTSLTGCSSLQLPCKNQEMATLQKFKLFATQCGKARSPTRSPRTSPMVQFRRRKTTLRMLLNRNTGSQSPPRRRNSPIQKNHMIGASDEKKEKRRELMRRNSLKELFVSSPPKEEAKEEIPTRESDSVGTVVGLGGPVIWSNGPGSPKPVWRGFRLRTLLKRGWRPGVDTVFE